MKMIRDYTKKLSLDEIKEIFDNFVQFEKDGFIGECSLRSLARKIIKDKGIPTLSIAIWMNMVANDCYRMITELVIEKDILEEIWE